MNKLFELIQDWRGQLHFRRVLERPYRWQRLMRLSFYAGCLAVMAAPFVVSSRLTTNALPVIVPAMLMSIMVLAGVQAKFSTPYHVLRLLTVPGALLLIVTALVVLAAWFATGQWDWLVCTPFALVFGTRQLIKEGRASLLRVRNQPYQRAVAQSAIGRGEGV